MRQISLTDEQAEWLERHLDKLLTDDSWAGSGPGARARMDDDAREHATAVKRKVGETAADGWGRPRDRDRRC